ncbi:MAG: VWA domain-containing protein [Planctomycetia bacterium]|nr:VWA domain-containing protein [Planctomycetia bacterium]
MPAPKMLSALPKPVLFGLYGAIGGLLGALAFGELIWYLLRPPAPKPVEQPPPEPQLAIAASKDLPIYQGGTNKLIVQIARAHFDEDVTVKVEGLPTGITAVLSELVIPKGKTEGEIELRAGAGVVLPATNITVVATAKPGEKSLSEKKTVSVSALALPMAQADIVFVLDVTESMTKQIDGLKNGIGTFANDLYKAKVDARFACVAFRDLTIDEPNQVLKFQDGAFTKSAAEFKREVERELFAAGGGDLPESSYEALSEGAGLLKDGRKGAVRIIILITDAPPKRVVGRGQSAATTVKSLQDNEIDLLHLVINPRDKKWYLEDVQEKGVRGVTTGGITDRGTEFDLETTAKDVATFTNTLLPEMTKSIAAAAETKRPEAKPELGKPPETKPELPPVVKSLQSGEEAAAGSEGLLVLRSGLWTAAIAALVCLFLLAGQHHYLRGSLPAVGGALAGLAGGLVVGVIGGAAGQGLFLLADSDKTIVEGIFRVFGWALLGGLAGVGLTLFIPNLKTVYGLAGGSVGGAVGAIGFIVVSGILRELEMAPAAADRLGRLAGGLLLGLFIGLMVAVVEAAFRRAWLEVSYGPRETVTVNLGAEPVKIGGDSRACTVWARGAADVALRYFIRDGRVICNDVPSRDESPVSDGDTRTAGNVTVTVRTGTSNAPAPATRRPAPPPVPKARPVPPKPVPSAPMSLDDEEPLPMPLPPSPSPAEAAATVTMTPGLPTAPPARPPIPPATPARPPIPTAGAKPPAPSAPTSPPAAPTTNPTTKDPDACPTCGRKIPGRPGTRFCMVCDQTF